VLQPLSRPLKHSAGGLSNSTFNSKTASIPMKITDFLMAFGIGAISLLIMMKMLNTYPGNSINYGAEVETTAAQVTIAPPLTEADTNTNTDTDNNINTPNHSEKRLPTPAHSQIQTQTQTQTAASSAQAARNSLSQAELNRLQQQLFTAKEEKIIQDEVGNYSVDISTPESADKISLHSSAPIYYPSASQLNFGVNGCVLGGYYIELGNSIRLEQKLNTQVQNFNYHCEFNAHTNSYFLADK
jgi:hypothetical protein